MRDQDFAYGGGLVTERGLRRMTRWGCALLAVLACYMITLAVIWPEPYARGWWLVLELLAVGQTVCAYDGVRLGFGNAYVFIQGGLQDIGVAFLIFPWVVRFYEHVSSGRFFDKILGWVARTAERHREELQGFGIVGLFLFVFLPVSGTGMLAGVAVGYLLCLPMRVVVPVIMAATLSSLGVLLVFFDWFEPILRSANAGLAQYFGWILLFGLLVLGWLYGAARKRLARWRSTGAALQPLREVVAEAGE
jgi:uncharacterized membrane protein